MMNLGVKTVSAILLALALSACGGGGGSSHNGPVVDPKPQPEPVPTTGPASTSTADLLAFARTGSTAPLENGINRTRRTQGGHSAWVDSVAGSNVERITYRSPTGELITRVVGADTTAATPTTGVYTGTTDLAWGSDKLAEQRRDGARIAIGVDAAEGTGWVDSIASTDQSTIQLLGGVDVVGGKITTNDLTVNVRDGEGRFIRNEVGSLEGTFTNGSGNPAILGTVGSRDGVDGFWLDGGFSVGLKND